ncbi:histone-lysine N-methyltransferase EHMT2-like, partial [Haliotis cracherodii]|uniref:histone-lysine N-methyltransferase EHMT2-like n=1 Tax=Haliotis cracherodii TaxID=6455 RepID=UPI0039ECED3F
MAETSGYSPSADATPSPANCRRLNIACCYRNLEELKLLLSLGVNVNCRWEQPSRTPVMTAAWGEGGRTSEVVELLVSKGADVSLMDNHANNFFFYACLGGSMKLVKFLLSLNVVDIDTRNKEGETAGDRARNHRT